MNWLAEHLNYLFTKEPVLILQAVQAGISLAVGFGLGWTGEQVALTVTFAGTILGLIARQQVTPTK